MVRTHVSWYTAATCATAILGSLSSAFAQAPQHEDDANSSRQVAGANEEFIVSEQIISRIGPIGYFGFEIRSERPLQILPIVLSCDVVNAGTAGGWLFAVPLWSGDQLAQLSPGMNLVAVTIQGFALDKLESGLSERHFDYIIDMAYSRSPQILDAIDENEMQSKVSQAISNLLTAIYTAADADFSELLNDRVSDVIQCEVSFKIALSAENIPAFSVALQPMDVAQWLGNFRHRDETERVRSLAGFLAVYSK